MPDQGHEPGDGAERDGHHVVGVLADADRVGPGLGDQQADDVADDDARIPKWNSGLPIRSSRFS